MQIGSSLNTQTTNYINQNQNDTQKVLSKIAATRELSGKDGADFINANALFSQISAMTQTVQNENANISMYQIADSTLQNLSEQTSKLNQLSVAYNNAALNDSQKSMLNKEFQATTQSMKDMIDQTTYNGQRLFSSDFGMDITGMDSLSIDNQKSISDFVDTLNSLASDISSNTLKSQTTIANSLSAVSNLTASYANVSETPMDQKMNDLTNSQIKLNSSILAQNHQNDLLKQGVSTLLG